MTLINRYFILAPLNPDISILEAKFKPNYRAKKSKPVQTSAPRNVGRRHKRRTTPTSDSKTSDWHKCRTGI